MTLAVVTAFFGAAGTAWRGWPLMGTRDQAESRGKVDSSNGLDSPPLDVHVEI